MTGSPTAATALVPPDRTSPADPTSPAATDGAPAHVVHPVPDGLTVRGTVLIVPGRGERAAVYTRLAARLAADAYRAVVVDADTSSVASLTTLVGELIGIGPAPLVAVGSDTGGIAVHDLAAQGTPGLAGAVLAGLPVPRPAPAPATGSLGWHDELDARTACPVHRERLDGDPRLTRGALLREPVEAWTARRPLVPTLVLHGGSDVISPLPALVEHLRGAVDRAVVVENGRHDVLNDLHHRSVAARLVQFLESLRRDPLARPVLSEVTP